MKSIKEVKEIPKIFEDELIEKLKTYFIVGGIPEVVYSWANDKDISKVNKISLIWNGIPSELARENKKFVYQVIKEGARAREYEGALNWLRDANLINKCYLVTK